MSSSTPAAPDEPETDYLLSAARHAPNPAQDTAALECIARLAPSLKEAELRALLQLAVLALHNEHHTAKISTRELSRLTNCARRNLQYALDALTARNLLTTRQGNTTRAAAYIVQALNTAQMPGVAATPPVASQQRLPGVDTTPPEAFFQRQPGVDTTPPQTQNQPLGRAPTALDSRDDLSAEIDRVLQAKPKDFDPNLIAKARAWLFGYRKKLGTVPNPLPPQDKFLAQFCALADWPSLEAMLQTLFSQRIAPGDLDAWFITVGLQRLYGIDPAAVRIRRERLKLVKPEKQQPPAPTSTEPTDLLAYTAAHVRGLR